MTLISAQKKGVKCLGAQVMKMIGTMWIERKDYERFLNNEQKSWGICIQDLLVFLPRPIRDQMTSHLMQKQSFAYIKVA